MTWTMPHRVLQIVGFLLVLAAAGSFAMGMATALNRGGRLPGERMLGGMTLGPTVDAQDAVPLSDERIEGPPPAPEKKEEVGNKAVAAVDTTAHEETPVGNEAAAGNAVAPVTPAPPPPGNAADALNPPVDEPPH